jgi:hypothetical protein
VENIATEDKTIRVTSMNDTSFVYFFTKYPPSFYLRAIIFILCGAACFETVH